MVTHIVYKHFLLKILFLKSIDRSIYLKPM